MTNSMVLSACILSVIRNVEVFLLFTLEINFECMSPGYRFSRDASTCNLF